MGILGSVFGGTYLATRGGGAKEQQKIQQGPPVAAGSKDEEDFIQYVHLFDNIAFYLFYSSLTPCYRNFLKSADGGGNEQKSQQ